MSTALMDVLRNQIYVLGCTNNTMEQHIVILRCASGCYFHAAAATLVCTR